MICTGFYFWRFIRVLNIIPNLSQLLLKGLGGTNWVFISKQPNLDVISLTKYIKNFKLQNHWNDIWRTWEGICSQYKMSFDSIFQNILAIHHVKCGYALREWINICALIYSRMFWHVVPKGLTLAGDSLRALFGMHLAFQRDQRIQTTEYLNFPAWVPAFWYLTCQCRPKIGQYHGFANIFGFSLVWGGGRGPGTRAFRTSREAIN